MNKVENGQTVSVHYVGTLDDGVEFDSSRTRGEPMSFQVGSGQLIAGFDTALPGMVVGEVKTINLTPTEGYGDIDPAAFQSVPKSAFPSDFEFDLGKAVQGQNDEGHIVSARIHSLGEEDIVLDFNHPFAGQNLNFEIELLSVQ